MSIMPEDDRVKRFPEPATGAIMLKNHPQRPKQYMTRKLVIANQKGGIGKSTTVANLGRAFAEAGYRTLLIDLDPQGGLGACYGVDSYSVPRSTYHLLMRPTTSIARLLHPVAPRLALLPANPALANAELNLASHADNTLRLRDALRHTAIPFDFVLIDTPPSLGILMVNGLVAADELLIPIQTQYLAMRGVRSILDTLKRIRQTGMNPDLKLGGVLGTLFQAEEAQAQEALAEMRAVFGEQMFQTVLAYCPEVAEAPAAGQSILDYQPNHPCAQAYRTLAKEILNYG